MRKSFWDKRIPTLLGLIILLAGTIFTTLVTNKKQLIQVNAVSSNQPQNVRITNITDTSFSVSYTTDTKTTGSINYGKDKNLGQSALDDRDQSKQNVNDYLVHTISAKNLDPSTQYFFTITSGQQIYTTDGNDFEVTTGPLLEGQADQKASIEGNIIGANGQPASEAIIYLTADNSQVISLLTDSNGHYSFLLTKVRTADLGGFYNFVKNQTFKMLVVGDSQTSNVTLSIPVEKVPTVILSKNYDFTNNPSTASQSANFDQTLSFPTKTSTNSAVLKILTPEKNETLSNQQPLFTGTAIPDQDIQITIHSTDKVSAVVTADSFGNWSYKPSAPLSAGTHTISITTKNSAGILQTITQSFLVYASTNSPTPTPQLVIDSPTPIPSDLSIESSTISATITETPSPTGQLPASGNPTIIGLGIMGIIVSFMGGLLFLLTRGGI